MGSAILPQAADQQCLFREQVTRGHAAWKGVQLAYSCMNRCVRDKEYGDAQLLRFTGVPSCYDSTDISCPTCAAEWASPCSPACKRRTPRGAVSTIRQLVYCRDRMSGPTG